MIKTDAFTVLESIYEGAKTILYRATRISDEKPVILKQLKNRYPSLREIAQFKREYEITKNLDHKKVVFCYGVEEINHHLTLVMEDFGGISLDKLIKHRAIDVKTVLQYAISIVNAIQEIHFHNIIHKDIKPHNIILNTETNDLKITDFGISSKIDGNQHIMEHADQSFMGTLAYISPEQTGRMNRVLDYRTDFYSLGVGLYESLTGKLPFDIQDAMGMIHAHIAKNPVSPNRINSTIPNVVSNLVMKLLSKDPEDRYQSTYGIREDLQRCLNEMQPSGKIESFELGSRDYSSKFQLPGKLFGRESQFEKIREACSWVCQGEKEVLFFTGPAGIGKTSLVNGIQPIVLEKRGYLLTGSFDKSSSDVPYSGFIQGLKDLIDEILMEKEEKLASWKQKFLKTLGNNGQLLIDLVPKLELLIGEQPPIEELNTAEAMNRFNFIFQNFLLIFASKNHPLIISLDDLDQADLASFTLIENFLTNPSVRHVLIICTFKDTQHPKIQDLKKLLVKHNVVQQEMSLDPISGDPLIEMIEQTFSLKRPAAEEMAQVVASKTKGNPFYITQFLTNLYEQQMVQFNPLSGWGWELEKIKQTTLMDNVIDLLISRFAKLPESVQEMLKFASCIGMQFDLNLLGYLCRQQVEKVLEDLNAAIKEGIIIPQSSDHQYIMEMLHSQTQKFTWQDENKIHLGYRFADSRLMKAIYSQIETEKTQEWHMLIGLYLIHHYSEKQQEENLFLIVNHLNEGVHKIETRPYQEQFIAMNVKAGKRAKDSSAFETALKCFRNARFMMDQIYYQEAHYQEIRSLYFELSETEYLNGNFEEAEQIFETMLKRSRDILEKSEIYQLKILLLTAKNKLREAIDTCMEVLRQLKAGLPEHPTKLHLLFELIKIKLRLGKKDFTQLKDYPTMQNQRISKVMDLIATISPTTYLAKPELVPMITMRMVNLSLKYGMSPTSCWGFGSFGAIQCGVLNQFEQGYRNGELAMALQERFSDIRLQSRIHYVNGAFILHWKKPIRSSLDPLWAGYEKGVATGDLQYAAYGLTNFAYIGIMVGLNLSEMERKFDQFDQIHHKLKRKESHLFFSMWHQSVRALLGKTKAASSLSDDTYDEEYQLNHSIDIKSHTFLIHYYTNKLMLQLVNAEYDKAVETAFIGEPSLVGVIASAVVPFFKILQTLAMLKHIRNVSPKEQRRYQKKIKRLHNEFQRWAKHSPENMNHKLLLIQAELARLNGKRNEAMRLYQDAIHSAHVNRFLNFEAIGNELAAQFYLEDGFAEIGRTFLLKAYYLYGKWGAQSKLASLKRTYPEILTGASENQLPIGIETTVDYHTVTSATSPTTISTRIGTGHSNHTDFLDFDTVLKSAQTFATEIELEKLLEKMVRITIENAGAQKGFIVLLNKSNLLMVEAEGSNETDEVFTLRSIPVEEHPGVCETITRYVTRTRETVILENASVEGSFTHEKYVLNNKPVSICCSPILNSGKLTGVIYLENNIVKGAFTETRVKILNILMSQMAISIENSCLYNRLTDINKNLEGLVHERTSELNQANLELSIKNDTMKNDLVMAQRVQESIMPSLSELAKFRGIQCGAQYVALDTIGGDLYDVQPLSDHLYGFLMADVSGHGVPAALITTMAKVSFSNVVMRTTIPAEVCDFVNKDLYSFIGDVENYLTAYYAVLNIHTGELYYSNAGHPPALLYHCDTQTWEPLDAFGYYIGIMEESAYETKLITIKPGDRLLLFTDGLIEAKDENRSNYGHHRMRSFLKTHCNLGVQELVNELMQDIKQFCNGEKPDDDRAILLIEYRPMHGL